MCCPRCYWLRLQFFLFINIAIPLQMIFTSWMNIRFRHTMYFVIYGIKTRPLNKRTWLDYHIFPYPKGLGIMCRLKNFLPTDTLRILYNSLILPHLQYSILSWGFKRGRLEKLQKRTIRIISNTKYNSHTDPLFKKLNLLKLKDLFELNVLKLFYKFKNNSLPF